MEPNEVMANEEVVETAAEEIVRAGSGSGFKVAAGFGLGILAGMTICKLARPVIAKYKTHKEAPTIIDVDVKDEETVFEETEEESKDEKTE